MYEPREPPIEYRAYEGASRAGHGTDDEYLCSALATATTV